MVTPNSDIIETTRLIIPKMSKMFQLHLFVNFLGDSMREFESMITYIRSFDIEKLTVNYQNFDNETADTDLHLV